MRQFGSLIVFETDRKLLVLLGLDLGIILVVLVHLLLATQLFDAFVQFLDDLVFLVHQSHHEAIILHRASQVGIELHHFPFQKRTVDAHNTVDVESFFFM